MCFDSDYFRVFRFAYDNEFIAFVDKFFCLVLNKFYIRTGGVDYFVILCFQLFDNLRRGSMRSYNTDGVFYFRDFINCMYSKLAQVFNYLIVVN